MTEELLIGIQSVYLFAIGIGYIFGVLFGLSMFLYSHKRSTIYNSDFKYYD